MFLCVFVVKNELYELTEEEIKVVEGKKQKLVAKHRILCKKQKNCGCRRSHIVNNADNNKTADKYNNGLIMKEKKNKTNY